MARDPDAADAYLDQRVDALQDHQRNEQRVRNTDPLEPHHYAGLAELEGWKEPR